MYYKYIITYFICMYNKSKLFAAYTILLRNVYKKNWLYNSEKTVAIQIVVSIPYTRHSMKTRFIAKCLIINLIMFHSHMLYVFLLLISCNKIYRQKPEVAYTQTSPCAASSYTSECMGIIHMYINIYILWREFLIETFPVFSSVIYYWLYLRL